VTHVLFCLALLAVDDKEADDAISRFKAAFKSTDVNARIEAITVLGAVQHEKVVKVLGNFLTTDEKGVRVEAVRSLGRSEKKSLAATLLSAALSGNAGEPEVQERIFVALGALGDPASLPTAYPYFETKTTKVGEAAIHLTAEIRSRNSIDPLLKLMKKLENAGEASAQGVNGQSIPANASQRERAKQLTAAAVAALEAITQEKFTTTSDWNNWWRKNSATFKVKG
jgi:HEAT repeat protein